MPIFMRLHDTIIGFARRVGDAGAGKVKLADPSPVWVFLLPKQKAFHIISA
jgi:hypothetical protein